jgi:hypothetical protein
MKKLFLSLIVSFGLIAFLPVTAMAQSVSPGAYVTGTVTHNGSPVDSASVVVTCDSNVLDSSTSAGGGYLVTFTTDQCPSGATAYVSASSGNLSGSNNGVVNGLSVDVNLALVDVSLVPEFGVITGIVAIIIGSGAFLVIRRRNIASHKN